MWDSAGRDEPSAWGVLLADVIRHVASAIQEQTGANAEETALKIMDSLQREVADPTSRASGAFHPGHS
jgi:hypothetical protein